MGHPKPLLPLGGRPLLARVLEIVKSSQVGEIVVVLGAEAPRVRKDVPMDGVTVVVNEAYAEGMSTSLRAGIRAASPEADGYVIALGDQPAVFPSTIDALIERHAHGDGAIFIPVYRGTRGNPVLVDRSLAGEVEAIVGDQGCRAIFPRHAHEVVEIPVEDPGVLIDVDTPEELGALEAALEHGDVASVVRVDAHRVHRAAAAAGREEGRPQADVLGIVEELRSRDEPFAVATVVRVTRPTSGKPGFKAVVRANRELIGWVGGSCAEAVVLAESLAAMRDGRPRLLRLTRNLGAQEPEDGVVEYYMECHSGGAMDIYVEPHLPKPRLVIVGDSPVAEALSALGRTLDFRVIVAAPGASPTAFPDADAFLTDLGAIVEHADGEAYVVVASMGKYDESAVRVLATSPAVYVGLVASRPRAAALFDALRAKGVPSEALDRVRSPAGLDLPARRPQEIALSILAEITGVRNTRPSGTATPPSAATSAPASAGPAPEFDVVCGMEVDPSTPLRATHGDRTYLFCSEGCRTRFLETPEAFL